MDIERDLKPQLPLPRWCFSSEADTCPCSQSPAQTPCTVGISSLVYGSLTPQRMAVFGLNSKQFREISLQIYFILFLLEPPSELLFSFSSQWHRICCAICGLWVPSCSFMQPIYIAQFSQGIKRSNFLHKILDPSLDFNGLFHLGLFSRVTSC